MVKYLDRAVMAAIKGTGPKFIIIDAPPRHGKSEYVSKHLPAWYLGRYPTNNVILCSYGAHFARNWGRKARDIYEQNAPELFGTQLSTSTFSANDWETNLGGGMVTAGVGGQITGRGANLFIIDDYIKNSQEALSEIIRESQWEWWNSTAYTRLEPEAVVIVMATRWHKEDLSGMLLEASTKGELPPILHIHLPAIAERDDYMGRHPGQPLWPDRWSKNSLRRKRKSMVKYWWDAMYQGRPGKHADTTWPPEYFTDRIWIPRSEFPSSFELAAIAADPSKGKTKRSDFSAILMGGVSGDKLFITGKVRRQPPEDTVDTMIELRERYSRHVEEIGLEENAWQDLLAPIANYRCKELGVNPLPFTLINNRVKKEIRIERLGPYLQADQLRFEATPDMKLLVQQLEEFPMADHDDGPDALEMLLRVIENMITEPFTSESN